MKYKMIIFDLDGTLCDTLEDLLDACNYALSQCGLPSITLEQTRSFVGNGIKNLLLRASNSQGNIEKLLFHFKEFYSKNCVVHTVPYPHIEDVLKYCKDRNLRIGVLTNKVESLAQHIIDVLFGNIFDFVYGEVEGRAKKPEATFLLEIIKSHGFKPEEVLYIGDSEVDIKTSENASVSGVFVSYGFRSKNELLSYTKNIVEEPLDLIQFIGA